MDETANNTNTENGKGSTDHEPPTSASTNASWSGRGRSLSYTATGAWTVLRKNEKPAAEIFSVSYVADDDTDRPITFIFNGGPGASSAFLHVGVVGPRRVAFPPDGSLPKMPPRLEDNDDSWLAFTDLVFIDPVGTGFSRVIEPEKPGEDKPKDAADPKEFFGVKRDLESLGEFMNRWLSDNDRWGSPIFIAGESYGGYRVGRMVRLLQEGMGIGLNGAILISPALEFSLITFNDYDMPPWIDRLPTMAAAAHHHGRSRAMPADASPEAVRAAAEAFATGDYSRLLAQGAGMEDGERGDIMGRLADFLGLDQATVERAHGRVPHHTFARELLRDERKIVGLYDASVTAIDPFPDREPWPGPDPTLAGIDAAFSGAINRLIRTEIGVDTTRDYRLLSMEVNHAWKIDWERHVLEGQIGATDDFRYGMSLNPHMHAFITHGLFDLITPYYASDRLRNLMRLDPTVADRITVQHYNGGHMFYAWEESRRAFTSAIAGFVEDALG
jgi:carboxypeptidase C (cathepsin A)